MNKYHATKTTVDGIIFDSRKESARYGTLRLLEQAGKISKLQLQVSFIVLDDYNFMGKKKKGISYIADFVYVEGGKVHIEDVKGVRTPVYRLKKKLFEAKYNLPIEEV
jgi:hypothetical protein